MKTIYASDFGVFAGKSCTGALTALLENLSGDKEEKALVFEKGVYIIDADALKQKELHITNTVADSEYKPCELRHFHRVGLHFNNISSLTVEGNGCTFLMDGKMTNIAITGCENITLKNFALQTKAPNLHCLTVVKVNRFTVEFELDRESRYEKIGGEYFWYGKGWRMGFFDLRSHAWWTLRTKPDDSACVFRSRHPFMGAIKIRETAPYRFTASYPSVRDFTEGETFHVYDTRRTDAGIFADSSRDITLENVAQSFNYSLAFVAQSCHNITLRGLDFSTSGSSERKIASLADFVQICMCSGTATVEGCRFEGAGDDVLNIHGIHFTVDEIQGSRAVLTFRERQTFGFNPLRAGHTLRFVDKNTLLEVGTAKIEWCRLLDPYRIEVVCDTQLSGFSGCAAEDADLNPDLIFRNNYMSLIPTRGLLITTRGRVLIENNSFHSNFMSSIDIADDAKNWYESGMVRDVTIKNNRFESGHDRHLFVHPENSVYSGAVHKNIRIEGNYFNTAKKPCFDLKCVDDVVIENNEYSSADGELLRVDRCENVNFSV